MTATARCDSLGNYGLAGASLGTATAGMIQDIATNWLPNLDAASIVPDLVIGLNLCENDIALGGSSAAAITSVALWLRIVMNKWPNCKVLLCTNRPDNRLHKR